MLKIPRIQFKNFARRNQKTENKNRWSGWFDLLLEGCISINGISIEIDGRTFCGESPPRISHNDAMTNVRLTDTPIVHRHKRRPKRLLDEHLGFEINEFLNRTHHEDVERFLKEETSFLADSEPFKPKAWKNKSLRIPVDYIAITGISGRDGNAQAHIRLGYHIILWKIPVYPTFEPDGVIFDERIIQEVEKILARKKAKDAIRYCVTNNTFDIEGKLVSKIPRCKKGKIPPVRLY